MKISCSGRLQSSASITALALACAALPGAVFAQAATDSVEEVIVTGSRIITNGNNAPTPVTVVAPEQLLATKPASLFENLAELPSFSGSRGASNGPIGAGATGEGTGVSALNLRNMGALRTLTLFDGQRLPPSTPDGYTDASALPQMLIQRVDVVTGGVSAVYGSNAVTGVVNYVIDRNFNGLKINAQTGISSRNDGGTYDIGIAAGRDVGSRGHFEFTAQRQRDNGLLDYRRDWAEHRWTVQGNGTTIPWHLQDNLRNNTATYGGVIACKTNGLVTPASCPTEPLVGQTFNQNGVLTTFDPGLRGAANGLASASLQIGGDGVYIDYVSLRSRSERNQAFARFDYDLTDNIHASISASGNTVDVLGVEGPQRTIPPGWNMGVCNLFLSAQIRGQLGCQPGEEGSPNEKTFRLQKSFDPRSNYGEARTNRLELENYFVMANLEGRFGESYRWNAAYTHGRSEQNVKAMSQNREKIWAMLDPVRLPDGRIVCRASLTDPARFSACAPINPFGPTAPSLESLQWYTDELNRGSINKQDALAGSISGSPFSLWAGPVDIALSAEVRRQALDLTSDALPNNFQNCTGLRFNNCRSTVSQTAGTWPAFGLKQTVKEGAAEINLPLIRDRPLFDSLSFNGAVRYTRYDNDPNGTSPVEAKFNATTWKAGLTWQVADQLTLRAARSRDIRAPSLYDLYLPETVGVATFAFDFLIDPAGAQVSHTPKSGGNPNLVPEVSNTTTLGLVFRPTSSLSLAVDAYSIDVKDVLYTLSGLAQPNQLACYQSGGTSSICQLQERPFPVTNTSRANAVTSFLTRQVNIARQKTHGVDGELNYRTTLFGRPASARALVTYQPHIYYYLPDFEQVQDTAGVAYPQIGGLPAPVWKGSLYLSFSPFENWTIDISERFRSKLHWSSDPTQTEVGGVPAVAYTNLTVTHAMDIRGARANIFFNVQNLFDKDPPPAGRLAHNFPGEFGSTYAVGDDTMGRYFTAGIRLRY